LVRQLAHDLEAQMADGSLLKRPLEIGWRVRQQIEGPAIVGEDDRHLLANKVQGHVDVPRSNMAGMTVLHQVREELLDEDSDARLLRAVDPSRGAEYGDEPADAPQCAPLGAKVEACLHRPPCGPPRAIEDRAAAAFFDFQFSRLELLFQSGHAGIPRRREVVLLGKGADMRSIARAELRAAIPGLAAALILAWATAGFAANSKIGMVKTVAGQAVIVRDGARLPAKVGDVVLEKDAIETGPDGTIGITLTDNTVMSAGPQSVLALTQYNFDSSNFNGTMLTDIRKGTLAVVSGDIARSSPNAMKVRTPTAILGVRGTRFTVQVNGER
ncbi:MAG TPA: FecR family protein, partial [Alphaproteobacteria bacterium]|nr:FecR family protein [Alphaproteobacteria bacterium]